MQLVLIWLILSLYSRILPYTFCRSIQLHFLLFMKKTQRIFFRPSHLNPDSLKYHLATAQQFHPDFTQFRLYGKKWRTGWILLSVLFSMRRRMFQFRSRWNNPIAQPVAFVIVSVKKDLCIRKWNALKACATCLTFKN